MASISNNPNPWQQNFESISFATLIMNDSNNGGSLIERKMKEGVEPPKSAAGVQSQKQTQYSLSRLTNEILRTLPIGVYPLKIIPFEAQLGEGSFRALHLKVDIPFGKEATFNVWWREFETKYNIRIHPTKAWATRGVESLLNSLGGEEETLLTQKHLPSLAKRLEHFHRVPLPISHDKEPAPIPLHLGHDLTHLPFITIDPETTLDREDSLCAIKNSDGTTSLFISFIDVTWYAKRGSALDRHIASRAYSAYGSYSAFPLLGRDFSFGNGSFVPNQKRLAWTFELTVSPSGEIINHSFYRAAVESKGAFSIEQAQQLVLEGSSELVEAIQNLCEVSHLLGIRRKEQDRFILAPSGEGKIAQIVSECMITANIEAAQLLKDQTRRGIYTTYALPSKKQEEQLIVKIRKKGIVAEPQDFQSAERFTQLWDKLRNIGSHSTLSEMLDRYFPRSMFSSIPHNHNGIPASSYLRIKGNTYAGIVNQWILEALINGAEEPFSDQELEQVINRQNRLTRSIDSMTFQLRFIEMLHRNLSRQGEIFSASVTEINNDSERGGTVLFEVHDDGFKKWGFTSVKNAFLNNSDLAIGDLISVRLEGFNRSASRFSFSIC